MVLRIFYQFHAFWRWFLVKVRCYSIDLINECLSLYCVFFFSGIPTIPDLCYVDKWSILYRPYRIRSLWLRILNLTKMLSFIIMSYLVEIISCRIFIFKNFYKIQIFFNFQHYVAKKIPDISLSFLWYIVQFYHYLKILYLNWWDCVVQTCLWICNNIRNYSLT